MKIAVITLIVLLMMMGGTTQQPTSQKHYSSPRALYRMDTLFLKANRSQPLLTNITIQQNEFVYIEVYGKISVGTFVGETDGAGIPRSSLSLMMYNKYPDFNHGSVVFLRNGKSPQACVRILEDLGMKYDLPGVSPDYGIDYVPGYYFIADEAARLSFDINDNEPVNNRGEYIIIVLRMSHEDHQARNYFNRCPEKKPNETDCQGHTWIEEGIKSYYYHGINDSYRGQGERAGCQCVYDDGRLITKGKNIGSFDIGYWHFDGDLTKPQAHYLATNPPPRPPPPLHPPKSFGREGRAAICQS